MQVSYFRCELLILLKKEEGISKRGISTEGKCLCLKNKCLYGEWPFGLL